MIGVSGILRVISALLDEAGIPHMVVGSFAKAGGSERQLADVAGIVRLRGAALDLVYLERWIDELALGPEWESAWSLR